MALLRDSRGGIGTGKPIRDPDSCPESLLCASICISPLARDISKSRAYSFNRFSAEAIIEAGGWSAIGRRRRRDKE